MFAVPARRRWGVTAPGRAAVHVGYDGHAFRREQQLGIGPLAREARAQTGNERTVRAVRFAARMGLYGALGGALRASPDGRGVCVWRN